MTTKQHLRITLLTDKFLPHAGGSRFYYYNLFKRIADVRKDHVTILTKKVPGWRNFDRAQQSSNFVIRRMFKPLPDCSYKQLPKGAGPFLSALAALPTTDVLHVGDLYPPGMIGLVLKRSFGMPYVAYCHGEEVTLTDQRKLQPKIRNAMYRNANAVIANGDFAVACLRRIGVDEKRIHKITPGVDTDKFYPKIPSGELRSKHGLTDDSITLLTVGRLVPRKGHDSVIKAVGQLAADFPKLKYLIVGKGPEEATLKRLAAEERVMDRVEFVGYVADELINDYYNLADVVLMPNREQGGDIEGFGMVFIEGSAAGKPVIAGRSGGAVEAVVNNKTGLLVEPTSQHDLVHAARELLSCKEKRHRFGQAGLERARKEFDWNSRAQTLGTISEGVVRHER